MTEQQLADHDDPRFTPAQLSTVAAFEAAETPAESFDPIAALRRVEALAAEYERRGRINADPTSLDSRVHQMAADRIRAALAAPQDSAR